MGKEEEPTAEEIKASEIEELIREWSRRGRPENGAALRQLFDAGEDIPSGLLDLTGLKPEKDTVGKLEMPPRTGKGSGQLAWSEFAMKVSDLDEAVLSKMNRDEIVEILEQRGIIPTQDEQDAEDQDAALAAN